MKKNTDKTIIALIIFVSAVLLISILVFLTGKDCPECYTGWQILGMQGLNFWGNAIFFSVLGFGATFFVVKKVINAGGVGVSLNWVIPIIIFFSIAFGKACTDKANNGVTSEKFKPTGPVDDGRESAEDQLKKAK
jgi:hypothetical protein